MVRGLGMLILVDVIAGAALFAATWALTRKSALWVKACAAAALWLGLATVEAFYWALNHVDEFNPRPATPLLVPAYAIYAALCLLWFAVTASKRFRPGLRRASFVGACALLIAAGVAWNQWPTEVGMSAQCEANLRHQWLALAWYAGDHGGRLPGTPGAKWVDGTRRYYTYRVDMLRCPMDKGKGETSYLLTPPAADHRMSDLPPNTVILLENKPRHHGRAHALLAGKQILEMKPGSVPHAH